ncbi:integrase, catalytic region, zinc finger, CCHC-type containing protein [Tanacetum coccineum]
MQGTSLTKQERECKLYDEFDKFTYKKGESLHEYYLRFTLLLNDMNIYKMHRAYQQQQPEFSQPDSSLVVLVFQKGDDPIDSIYHMMSFLTAVGRQTTYAAGTMRKYTPGASGSNTGKQRTVICYNCKGEGHIAKQCTKPKRKRDETWFNDKGVVGSSQASGQALTGDDLDALTLIVMKLTQQDCSMAISQECSDALTSYTFID